MKLFISWSGDRSKEIAEELADWLPCVIHAVEPWISTSNIEKGIRWGSEIDSQLREAKFGLICLTAENINSPWILYEAGALSNALENAFVCPYLFGIQPEDLHGSPLGQFQATVFSKDDTKKLLYSINKALEGNALNPKILDQEFQIWWPKLEKNLTRIYKRRKISARKTDREILEEILHLTRSSPVINEKIAQKIRKAYPSLEEGELHQMTEKLMDWYADNIIYGYQPARIIMNGDTISVRVLSFEEKNQRNSEG